ncbi:MAG TPA: transglutaminaseTgpA domain-containing protein [Gaiellaceae bacterium]
MLRTAALSGLAALVIAVNWLRFEEPRSGGGRPFLLAVLAIAPVLVRPLWPRLVAIGVSLLLGSWVALSVSPLEVWPGGKGFFAPLGSRFGTGFLDFYEFALPFDPARHPNMHRVILVAIFAFTLAVALAIAARRPLLAVLAFLLAAGWPATLLAGGNEIGRGVVILGVALALLAGLAERPTRVAFGATAAVIVGALALSSSAAVAKPAFLHWQGWDFYNRPQNPVSVGYVWDARYDGIKFPTKKTTVLKIRAPQKSQYWRATVLDRFNGTRWLERPWVETPRERRVLEPGAANRGRWVEQDVAVGALEDDHLVGATIPVQEDFGDHRVVYAGQGVLRAPDGVRADDHYTIWSYTPRPTPSQLARVPASYPRALTRPGRELDLAPGVTAPSFGAAGRDQRLHRLLAGRLQPYAEVYERAKAVAGQTRSPYAATVALEAWFRSTGGFTYSEQPGTTPGLPPLVGFIVDTKTGYCQHFAGGMALMLRLLGIPARVAAGFVPGHYRDGVWDVTDHDAHTWVEAWFPRYGWLPFDPTPGRGRLSGTYSSAALGFNAQAAARLLRGLVSNGEVFGQGAPSGIIAHDPTLRTPRSAGDFPFGIGSVPSPQVSHRPSLLVFLILLGAGLAAVIVLLKEGRRRLRYLSRDPRRIAVACARELSEYVQDQRLPASRAATFRELAGTIYDRLGVDASDFARAATAARYGLRTDAGAAAGRARTELREVKRRLRKTLSAKERVLGLVSVRSLGLG